MLYFLIFLFFLLFVWGLLLYIRKSLWDEIHRNLLDLEDKYGGHVVRHRFASRPVYHTKISGYDLAINFSADKLNGKRVNYINLSYGAPASFSCTIADWNWLQKQEAGEQKDYKIISARDSTVIFFFDILKRGAL